MSNTTVKAPRKRGRVRTPQSIAMSANMVKLRAQGKTLQAIADKYNSEKRREGKTLTAQAVYARLQSFSHAFPEKTAEIVASVTATPIASAKSSKKALPAVPNATLSVAA